MNKVKIMSDSTCDLTKELMDRNNITTVPLYVVFGDQSYRDGVDINTEELYSMVDREGILPKTSAPSPADFINAFKPHIENGEDIVYIGLSTHLSSTIQNAQIAAQEFPEGRIKIVDSENLSNGIGVLVLKAADLAKEGFSSVEIAEKITEYVPKVRSRFIVDTLDYLYKGGRCNALQSFVGGLLKIRPIVAVKGGKILLEEKIRGKREKAFESMLSNILADKDNMDEARLFVIHSMALQDAELLKKELEKELKVKEILLADAGCVISSHCGPQTVGIMYMNR